MRPVAALGVRLKLYLKGISLELGAINREGRVVGVRSSNYASSYGHIELVGTLRHQRCHTEAGRQ
jgi:hypothetical protein